MKNLKLLHAFLLILVYLFICSVVTNLGGLLFLKTPWWIPLTIGGVFWIFSLVFALLKEKHPLFSPLALLTNCIGASLSISAYLVGVGITLDFFLLPTMSVLLAVSYLILVALLSIPGLSERIWCVVLSFLFWFAGVILLCIFAFPPLFQALGFTLPEDFGMFFLFFLILLGGLSLGSLINVESFFELMQAVITPMLLASFFVFVIVLACLSGCDDCDCCDCGDCGDFSRENYKANTYNKKQGMTMSSYNT